MFFMRSCQHHVLQPMVYNTKELEEGHSVLKDEVIRAYETRLRPTGPTVQELSAITHTTKHRWYSR